MKHRIETTTYALLVTVFACTIVGVEDWRAIVAGVIAAAFHLGIALLNETIKCKT